MKRKYVYMVRAENGLFKIGTTNHLHSRVITLRSSSPVSVTLIRYSISYKSMLLESALHERFADRRSHGEWFRLSEDDLLYLETVLPMTEPPSRKVLRDVNGRPRKQPA